MQVSYIPDERDGVIHGFVVLATDITARADAEHRLQESADGYRALARNMPSGFVLLFDTELLFSVADGIELAAFGFTRESLEGKTLHEAFPPHLAAEVEPHYRAALRGETVTWERVVAERTFRLTAAPVDSDLGTVLSGIVVAVDVSEERRNERSWVALHSIAREVARKASPNDIAGLIAHTLQDVFAVDITAIVRFTGPGSGEILAMAPQHLETLGRTVSFAVGDASAIARVAETGHVSTVRYVTSGGPLSEAITAAGM